MYSSNVPPRKKDAALDHEGEDIISDGGDDDEEDENDEGCEYFQSLVIPPRRVWKSGMYVFYVGSYHGMLTVKAIFKFGIIFMIVLSSLIGLYCATDGHLYDSPMKYYNPQIPLHMWGQVCGWFCASIYGMLFLYCFCRRRLLTLAISDLSDSSNYFKLQAKVMRAHVVNSLFICVRREFDVYYLNLGIR